MVKVADRVDHCRDEGLAGIHRRRREIEVAGFWDLAGIGNLCCRNWWCCVCIFVEFSEKEIVCEFTEMPLTVRVSWCVKCGFWTFGIKRWVIE